MNRKFLTEPGVGDRVSTDTRDEDFAEYESLGEEEESVQGMDPMDFEEDGPLRAPFQNNG